MFDLFSLLKISTLTMVTISAVSDFHCLYVTGVLQGRVGMTLCCLVWAIGNVTLTLDILEKSVAVISLTSTLSLSSSFVPSWLVKQISNTNRHTNSKMKIMSSFTHPHVVSDFYDFLLWNTRTIYSQMSKLLF